MLPEYQGEEDQLADHAAALILLVRGTGVACAGILAGVTLFAEMEASRHGAIPPFGAGALLALLSVFNLVSARELRAWQLSMIGATPLVLVWVALILWVAWGVRDDPLWLRPLPAFLLPDLYALWTLLRGRGRLFVARSMLGLAALSSVVVAWLGAALLLA